MIEAIRQERNPHEKARMTEFAEECMKRAEILKSRQFQPALTTEEVIFYFIIIIIFIFCTFILYKGK